MWIVKLDINGPLSWSLNASETGESTIKMPAGKGGGGHGGRKK